MIKLILVVIFLLFIIDSAKPAEDYGLSSTFLFTPSYEAERLSAQYWKSEYLDIAKDYGETLDRLEEYEPSDHYGAIDSYNDTSIDVPSTNDDIEIGFFYYDDDGNYLYQEIH